MYTEVGDAIQAVDPGALIIAEGPEEWSGPAPGMPAGFGEGDLSGVAAAPLTLTIPNKVVYSVHEYPPDLSGNGSYNDAEQIAAMNAGWGYLETDNIAPVWVGEMGSNMTSPQDAAWIQMVLDYMSGDDGSEGGPTFTGDEQPVSGSWWQFGSEPGQDPDGILTSWNGTYDPAQRAATDQLLSYLPPQINRRPKILPVIAGDSHPDGIWRNPRGSVDGRRSRHHHVWCGETGFLDWTPIYRSDTTSLGATSSPRANQCGCLF